MTRFNVLIAGVAAWLVGLYWYRNAPMDRAVKRRVAACCPA